MSEPVKLKNWLIFVDTNIFLDFYRLGGESARRQIALLEKHKDRIILSEQVHMEFLRNRQRIILDSINKLEQPKIPNYPPIVTDIRSSSSLSGHIKKAQQQYKSLKKKIENILKDPAKYDPVYQALNRLLENDSAYNLKRPNKLRFEVRNLARKRFALGYPPRKQNDTSIGDALNWEWVIRCAVDSKDKCSVLIVTRDSDYGITYGQETYINDWLAKEFKDRVSRKRRVILTNKLTSALKFLSETVEEEDVRSEEKIIEKRESKNSRDFDDIFLQKLLERFKVMDSPDLEKERQNTDGDPVLEQNDIEDEASDCENED